MNVKPVTRSRAWVCVMINQLAFPGMGTVMAGRRVGFAQAAILLAGFFFAIGFLFCSFTPLFGLLAHSEGGEGQYEQLYRPYAWAGLSGLALCVIAWFWALLSSLGILRASQ